MQQQLVLQRSLLLDLQGLPLLLAAVALLLLLLLLLAAVVLLLVRMGLLACRAAVLLHRLTVLLLLLQLLLLLILLPIAVLPMQFTLSFITNGCEVMHFMLEFTVVRCEVHDGGVTQ